MHKDLGSQSGATMVEAAIAFPVFISIVFAVISFAQLGMAYEQSSIMMADAARNAVLIGSMSNADSTSCDDRARALFQTELQRSTVPVALHSFAMTREPIDAGGNGNGFLVSSEIQVNCVACSFLPGFLRGAFAIRPTLFVPAENGFACDSIV